MRPASEPMLTTAPALRAIMPSSTARVQLIMPHRLSWTSFSHSARSFSTKRRSSVQPTLLTSTSTCPVRPSTSRTMARTESHLVTSVGTTATEAAPDLRASAAVFSPCPASISAMVTCAPSRAKASEMARPMFDPPPVTMTLLPLRFSSMRQVLAVVEVWVSPRGRLPAVEIHGLAGHEAGGGGGQIHRQGRHLLGLADTARGNPREEPLADLGVRHGGPRNVRVHVARREAIDLDAVARPLGGKAPCEPAHRRLARAVGGVARHAQHAIHGTQVDDLAPAARDHARRHRPGAAEHRREVRHQHVVPFLVAHVERGLVERDAGIVDEDVDGAEGRLRILHGRPDLLAARHVERKGSRTATRCFDRCRRGIDLVASARRASHGRAGVRQRKRDGATDAAAGARDERGAAREGERGGGGHAEGPPSISALASPLAESGSARVSALSPDGGEGESCAMRSATSWRRRYFLILPLAAMGNSDTISRRSGNLWRASC